MKDIFSYDEKKDSPDQSFYYPERDRLLPNDEVLSSNPACDSVLYDINLLAEDELSTQNNDLISLEKTLWKKLLSTVISGSDKECFQTQFFFNLSSEFIKIIKKISLQNVKHLVDPLLLSFTIPLRKQEEILSFFRNVKSSKNFYTDMELNSKFIEVEYWLKISQILNSDKGKYEIGSIRTGLSPDIIELFYAYSSVDLIKIFIHSSNFKLQFRCTEQIICNILFADSNDSELLKRLELIKNQQIISASGYDSSSILKKIEN